MISSPGSSNVDVVRKYLAAIESGATGPALAAFFTDDAVAEELPNRLVPNGARRDLKAILAAAEAGQRVLESQRYEIRSVLATANRIALEVRWVGILAVPLAGIAAGGEMRAQFAMFLELRDGKIAVQRNYDCFDPW
jgi:ketosteroid isomerase-like protein